MLKFKANYTATQARFQQKQLQEKEQKLLQLYDQQQQRAYQVVQRGSAGSNGSNHGSTIRTTSTHHTTSTSQGGKVSASGKVIVITVYAITLRVGDRTIIRVWWCRFIFVACHVGAIPRAIVAVVCCGEQEDNA